MAREQKAKIRYLNGNGEEVKATENPAVVSWRFANGESVSVTLKDLSKDIRAVATVRGIAEKVRDTYAGAETVEDAYELAHDMVGRLTEGEWMSAREGGGPRMTMLLKAIQEVKENAGLEFDLEAARARYVATDEDTDEVKAEKANARKAAAANPQVNAVLERLRAEAAAKRAEKQAPTQAIETAAL